MLALPDTWQYGAASCGRAAAACVLRHFGKAADLRGLVTTAIDGTDPRTLESLLRKTGLRVVAGEMTAADLKHFTGTGRPVIAVVRNHYVVVAGVARGRVHYQDPQAGPARKLLAEFLDWWRDDDRLGAAYHRFGIAAGTDEE